MRFLARIFVVILLAGPASPLALGQQVECELRFVWDSASPAAMQTKLRLGEGFVRPVRNLSISRHSIGAVETVSPREILVHGNAPSAFGGLDFHITASVDTVIFIECSNTDNPEQSFERRIQVKDIMHQTWIEPIEELGMRIALERQVGDKLRVQSGSPNDIFSPGEAWPLSVSGYQTGLAAGLYQLEFLFNDERHHSIEVALDETGSFSEKPVEINVPAAHGGHVLELRLSRSSTFPSLLSKAPSVVRRYDIAVFSEQTAASGIGSWRELASIDAFTASQTGTLAWLAPKEIARFIPTAAAEFATRIAPYNPLAGTLTKPDKVGVFGQRPLTLDGQQRDVLVMGPKSWLAIPVRGLSPKVPHRLRIRYPNDQPQQLAVSVRRSTASPSAGGSISAGGPSVDSEFELKQRQCEQSPQVLVHESVFWPKGDLQDVLLLNGSNSSNASVLSVEISAAEVLPLASINTEQGDLNQNELAARQQASTNQASASRSVAIAFDTPYLPDVFAVDRTADPVINRQHETWSTWSSVANRLATVTQALGVNSVYLPAIADGAALQPSEILEPTSAFQSSAFFTDSRSPELKDATEFLLRQFDVTGQSVYIVLELNGRIPALEAKIRNTESNRLLQSRALDLAEPDGSATSETTIHQYNPLSKDVRHELQRAIVEIVQRYREHASFAGIQLRLTPECHFLFRGAGWGYDKQSLWDFQNAAGGRLDVDRPVAELFAKPAMRRSYLQWRAEAQTAWLNELAVALQKKAPGVEVVVDFSAIVDGGGAGGQSANPKRSLAVPAAERLLPYGLSLRDLQQSKQLVIAGKSEALGDASASTQPHRGDRLLIKHSTRLRVAEGTQEVSSRGRIYPVVHGAGRHNLQPIIEQLYRRDCSQIILEGWSPKMGNIETLSQFARTFATLPAEPMRDYQSGAADGIRVRIGRAKNATYIQVLNNAPWEEELGLQFQSQTQVQAQIFGHDDDDVAPVSHRKPLSLSLRPFDLRVIKIPSTDVRLVNVAHRTPMNNLQRLDSELSALQNVITRAGDPTHYTELTDLDGHFEAWVDADTPHGWAVSSLPQASIKPSDRFPRAGTRSAMITNAGSGATSAWMQSRQFLPPATNRMLVSAWLRSAPSSPPMHARVSISGRLSSGELYSRSIEVGGKSSAGTRIPIDWGRRPVQLFVDDIPSDDLQSLFVAIELIGPGKLWVDDVQVFEMTLLPGEQNHLHGQLLVARKHLQEGNAFTAEQLLGGPWGDYLSQHTTLFSAGSTSRTLDAKPSSRDTASGGNWNNPEPILKRWRNAFEERLRR